MLYPPSLERLIEALRKADVGAVAGAHRNRRRQGGDDCRSIDPRRELRDDELRARPDGGLADAPALAPAHRQATGDFVEVKNMRGLAGLEHHVVRNINQSTDAALAAAH